MAKPYHRSPAKGPPEQYRASQQPPKRHQHVIFEPKPPAVTKTATDKTLLFIPFIQKSAKNLTQLIIQVFQLSSPIHNLRLWVSDLKRSGSLIEEAGVTASTGLFFCA
jgi:hypothetical protein